MARVDKIIEELAEDWIPSIYAGKVRSGRTRSHSLPIPARANDALIQHTLLGIELKVGKQRISCPDLSTARYLRVFARLGVQEVAIPYDISRISGIADELETAWHRSLLVVHRLSAGNTGTDSRRIRSELVVRMRMEIGTIGAGDAMPEFNTRTRFKRG